MLSPYIPTIAVIRFGMTYKIIVFRLSAFTCIASGCADTASRWNVVFAQTVSVVVFAILIPWLTLLQTRIDRNERSEELWWEKSEYRFYLNARILTKIRVIRRILIQSDGPIALYMANVLQKTLLITRYPHTHTSRLGAKVSDVIFMDMVCMWVGCLCV